MARLCQPILMGGIAASILMTSFAAAPAAAAEQMMEEVVVTARRRSESVRDVPATVTVFSGEQLRRATVERASDIIRLTPGVSIVDAAEVGDTQVNIRGINGARDAENSFAFIIDGVLMTNPAAFNREFNNLEQIEILKGPQGALYGRNGAAGAVIVTTQAPDDQMRYRLTARGAEDDSYHMFGSVMGPIVEGRSYFSVTADWRDSDGYYSNSFRGDDSVDDFSDWNVNGRIMFEATDNLSLDFKARYGKVDAAAITFNAAFALPDLAGAFGNPDLFEDSNNHNYVFQGNINSQNDQEALELSGKFDYDAQWGSVTGWLLYSDIENSLSADGTSGAFGFFFTEPTCIATTATLFAAGVTLPSPQFLGPTPGASFFGPYTPTSCDGTQYQERNQDDISLEVRFASPDDQQLRWLGGLYFLHINREVGVNLGIDQGFGVTESLFVPQTGANPTEQLLWDDFDTNVYSVFGQLAYDVTDSVELAMALRYDLEDREASSKVPTTPTTQYIDFDPSDGFTGGAPLNPALNPAINPSGTIDDVDDEWSQIQPKLTVTWDVNENTTSYASWGVGFKSGGFNNQGSSATVDTFYNIPLGTDLVIRDKFDEETSSAFEIGVKARVFDGHVSLEAAVFHTIVDDMQFFEFLVGPFGLLRVVSNIDEVRITGFEVGANAMITDWLTMSSGFSYVDSEIEDNSSRPATEGNDSPYTPQFTFNLATEVDIPIRDEINFIGGIYVRWVGETWFHTVQDNTRTTLNELAFPTLGTGDYGRTQRDAFAILDLRAGVAGRNWEVAVFGKNVADEDVLEENITAVEFGGSFIHPGAESRWGVEATVNF